MHEVNVAQNIFATQLNGTLMGPVMCEQKFIEAFLTDMLVLSWEVSNGSRLTYPLPFGMFASIEKNNMSKSRLVAMFAPGFFNEPSAPVFNEICTIKQDIHELVCSANVCKKVVPINSAIEVDTTIPTTNVIWSSSIEAIDATHGLRTTIKNPNIVEQVGSVWDEQLHQFVTVKRLATKTFATASVTAVGDVATYVNYTPFKCGWFVKNTEQFSISATLREYTTTVPYEWPAVLDTVFVDTWPLQEGGAHNYAYPVYGRNHYSGQCLAHIVEQFHVTAPTAATPTAMMPGPIQINCPFFSLSEPPTLHNAGYFTIQTGTDNPIWANASANFPINATTPTDWPNSVNDMSQVQPYKGGFIQKTVVVDAPDSTFISAGTNTATTVDASVATAQPFINFSYGSDPIMLNGVLLELPPVVLDPYTPFFYTNLATTVNDTTLRVSYIQSSGQWIIAGYAYPGGYFDYRSSSADAFAANPALVATWVSYNTNGTGQPCLTLTLPSALPYIALTGSPTVFTILGTITTLPFIYLATTQINGKNAYTSKIKTPISVNVLWTGAMWKIIVFVSGKGTFFWTSLDTVDTPFDCTTWTSTDTSRNTGDPLFTATTPTNTFTTP